MAFRAATAKCAAAAAAVASGMLTLGTTSPMCAEQWSSADLQYSLAQYFDHTALKSTTTAADIKKLCAEAAMHRFRTVCVNSAWVATARAELDAADAKDVGVCAVIGFPLGAADAHAQGVEAHVSIARGAVELDMVLPVGLWRSEGGPADAAATIALVVDTAGPSVPVKVILETALLTDEEIVQAVAMCRAAGAAWVKTSTGFGPGGATPHAVALMHAEATKTGEAPAAKVKASGGVRTLLDTLLMIRSGASRVGASASVGIMGELQGLTSTSPDLAQRTLEEDGVVLQAAPASGR